VRTSGVDAEAAVPVLARPGTFGLFSSTMHPRRRDTHGSRHLAGPRRRGVQPPRRFRPLAHRLQPAAARAGCVPVPHEIWGGMWWGNCNLAFPIITTFTFFLAILLPTVMKLTRFVPAGRLRPAIMGSPGALPIKKPLRDITMLNSIEPTDSSTETDGNPSSPLDASMLLPTW
jgi:hypothetical protein